MKMTFRWYGQGNDSIPLEFIRQIPNTSGVVTAMHDIPVGLVWPVEQIMAVKENVNAHGLEMEVIESVNVHEDIKIGLDSRDEYIENYITTIKNLAKAGVKCICYNFMPVFDWTRTDMAKPLEDKSTVLFYSKQVIENIKDPQQMFDQVSKNSNGFVLPGWEPDKMSEIQRLFEQYKNVDEEKLFSNLQYFLKAIIPVCEENDVKMAIHPDDPPWGIFGLPRIINSAANLERFVNLVDSPYNGITLCSGSLGANPANDIPAIIRKFGKRIHFGHVRNIKIHPNGDFGEVSHFSADGSLDLYEIMKAYYEVGFDGYIRPDHGRMIWNEKNRPGYGLYDRALGIAYLNGLLEAIQKGNK